jgi:hypothetical protein
MAETGDGGVQIYTEGDIGQVEAVDYYHGGQIEPDSPRARFSGWLGCARVWWPRTRRTSMVPQISWLWFRVIMKGDLDRSRREEAEGVRFMVNRMRLEALPHVFFTRAAELVLYNPRIGDLVQVAARDKELPAAVGDVGTIVKLEEGENKSIVVAWSVSGVISTLSQSCWESLRFIRLPIPIVGDLFRTLPHVGSDAALVADGVAGGDVAWVTSLRMNAAHEHCVEVLWARTGRSRVYLMESWPSRFNLIPLDKGELSDQLSMREASYPYGTSISLSYHRNVSDIMRDYREPIARDYREPVAYREPLAK